MNRELLIALTNNAALLLALGIVHEVSYLLPSRYKQYRTWIRGFFISLICVIIMSTRFVLAPGLVFDTRSILISLTAFTFGAVPTLMTVAAALIYRVIEGGVGVPTGVSVIVSSALIGYLWRRRIEPLFYRHRWFSIFLMSIAVHIAMLLCMLLLPHPQGIRTIREIALPVMLIYPAASLLLGLLLIRQEDRNRDMIARLEAESRYRSLFDNQHTVMMLLDPRTQQIIDVNPAAEQFYGWPRETMRTMHISDINPMPPQAIQQEIEKATQVSRNHFIFRHRLASGELRDVEIYSNPVMLGGRQVLYSIIHDITRRLATEQELASSEQRFRTVVENAPEAIFIQSSGRFIYLNQAACHLFGAADSQDLLGTNIFDRFHPDYHPVIENRISSMLDSWTVAETIEEIFIRLDGSQVDVEVSAIPIIYNQQSGILVFSRDITARKRAEHERSELEAQMRQQQKLDAIGLLAGGVAHEVNNPINGIMNYTQLLLDETDQNSESATYLRSILRETRRVSEIVRNLLQFSRQDKQSHSYARIEDIVEQTVSLIRTLIRKDQIDLQIDLPDHLPDVKCRSQQIQQVLLNLLTNARDALNARHPGYHEDKIIRLTCHAFEQDGRRWITLTVEDHGIGIDPAISQKIFEPFFSTKPKENGTGLGLSISFGIVRDHHGRLACESQPGQWTRFHVTLPVDNGWPEQTIRGIDDEPDTDR